MTDAARTPCCVPFCRRTTKAPAGAQADRWEWICPKHWRAIPLARRRAYARPHAIWYGADGRGMVIAEIWPTRSTGPAPSTGPPWNASGRA